MTFKTVELSKFIKIQGGYAYKSNDFKIGGENPVLKIKNVRFGHIEYENAGFISDGLASSTDNFSTAEGDILISMTGSGPSAPQSLVGRVARVWKGEPKAWINQRVGRVVLKEENKIHPDFIFYLLSSKSSQDFLVANSSGSANQANINGSTICSLPCPDIDFNTSKKIAVILKSLDEKIRINRQLNKTLEHISQAIFKSWFVDFEPTKAKIAAREVLLAEKPDATPEQISTAEQQAAIQAIAGAGDIIPTEQLQNIADLFPNQMVDSDLGEMPEGWEVCISGELIDVRDGTHDSPKKAESGYPLVTSKHITSGVLKLEDTYLISEEDFEKVNKRSAVKTGDILLTMIGTVGIPYLVLDREVNFAIKNVGLFRTSKSKNHQFYIYLLLKTQMMQDYLEARMAGTTQKYLSLKVLRNLEFISPPLDSVLLSHFNLLLTPIMNLIQQNSQQTYSLAELRDSLLPKLLSGEISFEDKDID